MTWIKTINFQDAKGKLLQLYKSIVSPQGHIDNVMKTHSLRPRTMEAHLNLYKAVLHSTPNELSSRERELVAVTVSLTNQCEYSVLHHRTGLSQIVKSEELASELTSAAILKIESDNITDREMVFCKYAVKLTETPWKIAENDIKGLRGVGLSDTGILDLNQIIAYFAYSNRTLSGLGTTTDGEPLGFHPVENESSNYGKYLENS